MHRPHKMGAEFLAQRANVGIDSPGTETIAETPDLGQQLIARVHDARSGRHPVEKVEFDGSQMHRASVPLDLSGRRINFKVADYHRCSNWGWESFYSPEDRLDPCNQLTR